MKIKCPGCRQIFHQTTRAYQPNIRANGAMVELLDPWKSWGWEVFGDNRKATASVLDSEMFCPSCDSPMAPGGRLWVMLEPLGETLKKVAEKNQEMIALFDAALEVNEEIQETSFICPECGWEGKTEPALKRHITMRHG